MRFADWFVRVCMNYSRPLSIYAYFVHTEHEIERDRQIIEGVYSSEMPYSLGGYAVVQGEPYAFGGYDVVC